MMTALTMKKFLVVITVSPVYIERKNTSNQQIGGLPGSEKYDVTPQ
jgi:hypothetical protein